jgi:hypothetical protein
MLRVDVCERTLRRVYFIYILRHDVGVSWFGLYVLGSSSETFGYPTTFISFRFHPDILVFSTPLVWSWFAGLSASMESSRG